MGGLFDQELQRLLGIEGEFSDHQDDSGGATRYGITEGKAREHGYTGPMEELPPELARKIYRADFWDALNLDEIGQASRRVAGELFDTGVNCGAEVAGEFLQRCLNAFNRRQKDYADVTVDGLPGIRTIEALSAFLKFRGRDGEVVLLRALNSLQGARYIRLVEAREKDEAFCFGWFRERVTIR